MIEVMGLAVLPSRLDKELQAVADGLIKGEDLTANPLTASHAEWAKQHFYVLLRNYEKKI